MADFKAKSEEEIRDDYLRTYRNALIRRGIANPNISESSEAYVKATSLARQIAAASAAIPAAANSLMPDTAIGDDLTRAAALLGLSLRGAGGSAGAIVLGTSVGSAVAIPVGAELLDPSGLRYHVAIGGSYSAGDSIPIESTDRGTQTNLAAGVSLKWTAPPAFVTSSAVIATGGLTGGVDAETPEGLRARLLERYRHPPNGSNWSTFVLAAEESSGAVQKGFAYPAAAGPGTVHVAVVGVPSETKSRAVDSLTLTTTIAPAVAASAIEAIETTTTTVTDEPVDISIGLSLPQSKQAIPAGPGGGFINATPFPVVAATGYAAVTVGSTSISIPSDNPPIANVSQICWLSPHDWTFHAATIKSFSGSGPYTIALDKPLPGLATGDWICPLAENSKAYFETILATFGKLGPGEKTNLAGLLPRAYRKPNASESWFSDLDPHFLRSLSDSAAEILDVQYLYRSQNSPTLPASVTDSPKILIPRKIGIYPIA